MIFENLLSPSSLSHGFFQLAYKLNYNFGVIRRKKERCVSGTKLSTRALKEFRISRENSSFSDWFDFTNKRLKQFETWRTVNFKVSPLVQL